MDFEEIINGIKDKVGDENSALISEDLLNLMSSHKSLTDQTEELSTKVNKLESEKDELLKVNGRLFQRIGFDAPETKEPEIEKPVNEPIPIESFINDKGEFI